MTQNRIRIEHPHARIKRILNALIGEALKAADPQRAIQRALTRKGNRLKARGISYNLTEFRRIVCVGAGKASGLMAVALEDIMGDSLEGGLVVVKDGYGAPTKKIRITEAAHPVPDRRSANATGRILSLVRSLTKQDLAVVLLSGGASSLFCAPAHGLELADKQVTTELLLRSGAMIHEINIVRKHLSAIKGGQLLQATPASVLTLIISDVLGDDPSTIGSGPTIRDPSTFQDALDILKKYKILSQVPPPIRRRLLKGLRGDIPETLKKDRRPHSRNFHLILANNQDAVNGVAKTAGGLNLKPFVLPVPFIGEARVLGNILGSMARDLVKIGNPVRPPACLIAGGEPTVTVKGRGNGGRAQECVLAAAQELTGLKNVFVAGFGTDGTDGPTEAAGAIVDEKTAERASRKRLDIARSLRNNDSYHFLKTVGGHIITGPTCTNVNDIYLIIAL